MKILALTLLLAIPSLSYAEETIVLTERNTISLNSVVSSKSVAKLTVELISKSQQLAPKDVIYLVLDTPGGSVEAGLDFLQATKAVPQEIKTISLFAASMGFHMQQALGERLILSNSVLMSHRAAGGIEGTMPGSFNTQANLWLNIIKNSDSVAAKRMNLSLDKYYDKIRDEYWVSGEQAIKDKAADRVVKVICDKTLEGTSVEYQQVFIFSFRSEKAKCPLVRGALDSSMSRSVEGEASLYDEVAFKKAMNTLYNNKAEFTRDYILTNKWQKFGF